MNGDQVQSARERLGEMWGLGRPLSQSELASMLDMRQRHEAGRQIRRWEMDQVHVPGPVSQLLQAWLLLAELGWIKQPEDPDGFYSKPTWSKDDINETEDDAKRTIGK